MAIGAFRVEFIVLSISAAIILSAFCHLFFMSISQDFFKTDDSSKVDILIGVLSSRDNFANRKAIRQTWGKVAKQAPNVKLRFFIGKACPHHPLNRLDIYSCSKHPPFKIEPEDGPWTTSHCISKETEPSNARADPCARGFGFRVLRPLILSAYLVHMAFVNEHQNASLIFKDAEEVFEKRFVTGSSCDVQETSWCRIPLKRPLELPAQFEGEIHISVAENFYRGASPSGKLECSWKVNNALHYTFIMKENVEGFSGDPCSLVSLEFSSKEPSLVSDSMSVIRARDLEWKSFNEGIDKELETEHQINRDFVFLPFVDVYQNLPSKVLYLIEWSHLHYAGSFTLKIDDDTFLNTSKFFSWMFSLSNEEPLLWSEFRYHRSVPLFGKWADYDYQGLVYPPFPSGAAYLLSGPLTRLLSKVSPYLRIFQGEDISMGMWTEFLCSRQNSLLDSSEEDFIYRDLKCHVEKSEVPCWLPSSECEESFVVPQCQPQDFYDLAKT